MNKSLTLLILSLITGAMLIAGCTSSSPEESAPAVPETSAPGTETPTEEPDSTTTPPETEPTPEAEPPVTQPPVGSQIGNLAPDFDLKTLDGEDISLSSLRGKPVLLNFWATWCPPCRFEMPFLQEVHDKWSDEGLVLLAIDIGESADTVQEFMTELDLSLTVPMDTDRQVARDYLITAVPTSFLIDKNGVIRQKVIGAFPNAAAIEAELGKIIP